MAPVLILLTVHFRLKNMLFELSHAALDMQFNETTFNDVLDLVIQQLRIPHADGVTLSMRFMYLCNKAQCCSDYLLFESLRLHFLIVRFFPFA